MNFLKDKNWQSAGLAIINSHIGKKRAYETYLRLNPVIAEAYLRFVSKHRDAVYISWDREKQKFVA